MTEIVAPPVTPQDRGKTAPKHAKTPLDVTRLLTREEYLEGLLVEAHKLLWDAWHDDEDISVDDYAVMCGRITEAVNASG